MTGLTITESALAAGCPVKSASQAGSRLEKHPNVIAHIGRKEKIVEAKKQAKEAGKPFDIGSLSRMYADPADFLKAVMNDVSEDVKLRVDAARVLMPYVHAKPGEKGKKTARQERAEKIAGKFSGLRSVK